MQGRILFISMVMFFLLNIAALCDEHQYWCSINIEDEVVNTYAILETRIANFNRPLYSNADSDNINSVYMYGTTNGLLGVEKTKELIYYLQSVQKFREDEYYILFDENQYLDEDLFEVVNRDVEVDYLLKRMSSNITSPTWIQSNIYNFLVFERPGMDSYEHRIAIYEELFSHAILQPDVYDNLENDPNLLNTLEYFLESADWSASAITNVLNGVSTVNLDVNSLDQVSQKMLNMQKYAKAGSYISSISSSLSSVLSIVTDVQADFLRQQLLQSIADNYTKSRLESFRLFLNENCQFFANADPAIIDAFENASSQIEDMIEGLYFSGGLEGVYNVIVRDGNILDYTNYAVTLSSIFIDNPYILPYYLSYQALMSMYDFSLIAHRMCAGATLHHLIYNSQEFSELQLLYDSQEPSYSLDDIEFGLNLLDVYLYLGYYTMQQYKDIYFNSRYQEWFHGIFHSGDYDLFRQIVYDDVEINRIRHSNTLPPGFLATYWEPKNTNNQNLELPWLESLIGNEVILNLDVIVSNIRENYYQDESIDFSVEVRNILEELVPDLNVNYSLYNENGTLLEGYPKNINQIEPGIYNENNCILPTEVGVYKFSISVSGEGYEDYYDEKQINILERGINGISLVLDPSSVNIGSSILCTVELFDNLNEPIPNEVVTFSSNRAGEFIPEYAQALTNESGVAQVVFIPEETGPGVITVSTSNNLSFFSDFTVVGGDLTFLYRQIYVNGSNWSFDVETTISRQDGSTVSNTDAFMTTSAGYWEQTGNQTIDLRTNEYGRPEYGDNYPRLVISESQYPNGAEVTITSSCNGSTGSWTGQIGGRPENLYSFIVHNSQYASAWQPNTGYLALGTGSGQVTLFDPENSWAVIRVLNFGGNTINDMSFSPDGQKLAFVTNGVYIGNATSGSIEREVSVGGEECIAWSPDGSVIAVGTTSDKTVYLYNSSLGLLDSQTYSGYIRDIDWNPASNKLSVAVDNAEQVYILNRSGNSLSSWRSVSLGSMDEANGVAFSRNGNYVAIGSKENSGAIYNISSQTLTSFSTQQSSQFFKLDWCPVDDSSHPGYNKIIAATRFNGFGIYRNDGSLEYQISGTTNIDGFITWSDNGDYIAYGFGGQVVAINDMTPPEIAITSHFNNQQTQDEIITLEGYIRDSNTIYSTSISLDNGNTTVPLSLSSSGNFSPSVSLQAGDNSIIIQAVDGPRNSSSTSINIKRLVDTEGPLISNIGIDPLFQEIGNPISLTLSCEDLFTGLDGLSVEVDVVLDSDLIYTTSLLDDGLGGDEIAGDGIFYGEINTSGFSEVVYSLTFRASDINNFTTTIENSYTVSLYDNPSINNITYTPENPSNLDGVNVSADITDLSEITDVYLHYSNDGSIYSSVAMACEEGTNQYSGRIDPQNSEQVYYKIQAIDIFSHQTISSIQSYNVIILDPPSPPILDEPHNLSTEVSSDLAVFVWIDTSDAVSYDIQIDESSSFFTPRVFQIDIDIPEFSTANLLAGQYYYWRIRCKNEVGTGDWSEPFLFRTLPTLSTPILRTPVDDSSYVDISTVNLEWEAVDNCEYYRIQLSSDNLFNQIIIEDVTGFNYFQCFNLDYESTYYWRIKACNDNGYSDYSPVFRFTTLFAPPMPLQLQYPVNELCVDSTVTLEWSSEDTLGSPITFNLYIEPSDSLWEEPVTFNQFSRSDTTYLFTGVPHTEYWWKVNALNQYGDTTTSDVTRFWINGPPETFELLEPPDGSVLETNQEVVLIWESSSDSEVQNPNVEDSLTYIVEWTVNQDFSDPVYSYETADTFLVITDLEEYVNNSSGSDIRINPNLSSENSISYLDELPDDSTIYWRVKAKDNYDAQCWSVQGIDGQSFGIAQPESPLIFNLISPANNSVCSTGETTLIWQNTVDQDPNDSIGYILYMSLNEEFTVIDSIEIQDTTHTLTNLLDDATYWWKVRAQDSNSDGTWSDETWSFSVAIPEAPESFTLVSPENNSVLSVDTMQVNWTASSDPDPDSELIYIVQWSTDASFQTYYEESTVDTFYVITDLDNSSNDMITSQKGRGGRNDKNGKTQSFVPKSNKATTTGSFTMAGKMLSGPLNSGPTTDAIDDDVTVFWRVYAEDNDGLTTWATPGSNGWQFSIYLIQPPLAFSLDSPANGATCVTGDTTLTWNATIDPDPDDAVTYVLYLSTDEDFTDIDSTLLAGTSLEVENLLDDTTYWWKVRAQDTNTNGIWSSETWSFNVTIPVSPGPFVQMTPTDGSQISEASIQVNWSRSLDDDPGDVLIYEIQWADNPEFNDFGFNTTSDTFYTLTELADDQIYYWRVKVTDNYGLSTWAMAGEVGWSFAVNIPQPPLPFNLAAPDSGLVLDTLAATFEWNSTTDPDPGDVVSYALSISLVEDFHDTATVCYNVESESSFNIPYMLDDTNYWWRVKASDNNGDSTFSNQIWTFHTAMPEPPYPFELEDGGINMNATGDSIIVTLEWKRTWDPDPESLEYYKVLLDTTEDMNIPIVLADSVTVEGNDSMFVWTIAYEPEDLPMLGNGYWTVYAYDYNTDGTWADEPMPIFMTSVDETPWGNIPGEYEFAAAYPNPFNPMLTAVISLPHPSDLTVTVFNVMGQRVATIAEGHFQEGFHSFVLNGQDMASGVYFVHASVTGQLNQVKKVVLMK